MKKLILITLAAVINVLPVSAQKGKEMAEGTPYYLPLTCLRFSVLYEKTSYTPGEFSIYAEKYLKTKDVGMKPVVSYRITDIGLTTFGERDTSKYYIAPTDTKHNIRTVDIDENSVLLAINAEPKAFVRPDKFVAAPRKPLLNPRDYMNEEILSAGSTAKMAELCASEIYDIRESRALLSKGQAEFMPKDGGQLRLMLDNLETQEQALLQLFYGVTRKDTIEKIITFVPERVTDKQLLFRFSKWSGMTDIDDLGGSPYYISVENLNITPAIQDYALSVKPAKNNGGIYVNLPGKIRVTLFCGGTQRTAYELYAAQFGRTEHLNDALFGKKMETSVVLNPVTGNLDNLRSESERK